MKHTARTVPLLALIGAVAACVALPNCGASDDPAPVDPQATEVPPAGQTPAAAGSATPDPRPEPPSSGIKLYRHEVVATYPHDSAAFTQGLVFDAGRMYESTGQRGQSTLRQVSLEDGAVLRNFPLENGQHFAEGLEVVGDKLYQLTWHARVGYIYNKHTFELLGTFNYPGEGWGLTYDGTHLVLSDGTPTLRFLDPETFVEARRVTVTGAGRPVRNINELEFIEGEIWANVWKLNEILRIDPETGNVVGVIDMSGLNTYERQLDWDGSHRNVLNGIAYDEDSGRIFVTGKQWPELHEIRVVDA